MTTDPNDPKLRKIKPDGQQEAYLVLSDEERAKGFVRPLYHSYIHLACGTLTRMSTDIAATYARDPYFYGGTFCCHCGAHFPLVTKEGRAAFKWDTRDGSFAPVGGKAEEAEAAYRESHPETPKLEEVSSSGLTPEEERQRKRWIDAAHAMQTGVKLLFSLDNPDPDSAEAARYKDIRTGVNAAMRDHGSLVDLLVKKGVMTRLEYMTAIADGMEAEKRNYERELAERLGRPVILA